MKVLSDADAQINYSRLSKVVYGAAEEGTGHLRICLL